MKVNNFYFNKLLNRCSSYANNLGVVSIEYALMVCLIAVAILGALQSTGTANGEVWTGWTDKIIAAVKSVIGP